MRVREPEAALLLLRHQLRVVRRQVKRPQLSAADPWRSSGDTRGHVATAVRDREAPGSNPGPPTNF